MDLYLITGYFIATFFSIHGLPVTNSVYEMIKRTDSDVNFKCPYVRTTKLLEPAPKFLSNCNIVAAQSLTVGNPEDALCLLYYDTFEHLCYVSNNYTENIKGLLSNDQIELIPVTYQSNVNQVCAVLKNTTPFLKESISGIEVVRTHLEDSKKCERLCTDWDMNVKPICSLTAFMMNVTTKVYQEIQNSIVTDLNEKAKNKPSVTDHNADNHDDSNNKPVADPNRIQNPSEVVNSSISTENNSSLGQTQVGAPHMPNTSAQQNLTAQNSPKQNSVATGETPEKKGIENRWDKFFNQPLIEPHNPSGDQSVVSKAQSTSSDSSVNIPGKNTQQQSGTDEEEVPLLQSSAAPSQNNVKPHKDEPQINAPSNSEKLETPQVSSSSSTNSGNTAAQIPGGPATGGKIESVIETKPEENILPKETEEGGENRPGIKSPSKKEGSNNEDIVIQEGNSKQSTKGNGGIEAAGESPQDLNEQFLDDPDGDADSETGFGNNPDDYLGNDDQPKTNEVKSKPVVEKSKPREIDEDGPSFAANYQNQSIDDSDSYFFSYFMMVCIMFICGYVAYHNKQKILALVVEGRKGRRTSRTRRPNSANYRKLDSNLEEAVTSSCNKNATQVIY